MWRIWAVLFRTSPSTGPAMIQLPTACSLRAGSGAIGIASVCRSGACMTSGRSAKTMPSVSCGRRMGRSTARHGADIFTGSIRRPCGSRIWISSSRTRRMITIAAIMSSPLRGPVRTAGSIWPACIAGTSLRWIPGPAKLKTSVIICRRRATVRMKTATAYSGWTLIQTAFCGMW